MIFEYVVDDMIVSNFSLYMWQTLDLNFQNICNKL